MEKTIQHSLKVVFKLTKEQQKYLRRKMCCSHDLHNTVIFFNRQTENNIDIECKQNFINESNKLFTNIEKFKKNKDDIIEKIKLEMKEKGVSNIKKKKLKNQKDVEILKYKKLIAPYYKKWNEIIKEIKKEYYYPENNLWQYNTLSKYFADNPKEGSKHNPKSMWFKREDINRDKFRDIGCKEVQLQILRKLMSSIETTIKIRAKGKCASMPKYNETKIKEEDKIYQEGNSLFGYYPLILSGIHYKNLEDKKCEEIKEWKDIESKIKVLKTEKNNIIKKLKLELEVDNVKKDEKSIITKKIKDAKLKYNIQSMKLLNEWRRIKKQYKKENFSKFHDVRNKLDLYIDGKIQKITVEFKANKYFDKIIKYDRLEIKYDMLSDKFYGIFSCYKMIDMDDKEKKNIVIIDLGQKNMFSCIVGSNKKEIINKLQINTKNEYEEIRKLKYSLKLIQHHIDKELDEDKLSKKDRVKKNVWKRYKFINRKVTNRSKSLINEKVNILFEFLQENKVGEIYIGELGDMKLNKWTNIWLRGYIEQRLKDKCELYNINLYKVKEYKEIGKIKLGSSYTCPSCGANPWLINEFIYKDILQKQLKTLKMNEKKSRFRNRENNIFHCPCCKFIENDDYVGAINIGVFNNLLKFDNHKVSLRDKNQSQENLIQTTNVASLEE